MRIAVMLLALSGAAFAGAPPTGDQEGERYRLEMELDRHAGATRWKGVERTYQKLLDLGIPLSTGTHYTAAIAAENQGDVLQTWLRLERAIRHENALEPAAPGAPPTYNTSVPASVDHADPTTQAALQTYNGLLERYGRASITVEKGRIPALVRMGDKPFGSTERGAITSGQEQLASNSRFVGLLPVGRYMVDGEMFEVQPNELTVVRVVAR
ncbi:MAG: hypothetical protein KC656_19130 [Myxococcales bacterium]|nr:hypothetical protein [Myxococcales bacterium]MCB9693648.1 hypothetical protein [Alphaproteobacteria bacterium]